MQKILDFERNGIKYHAYQFNGSSRGETIKNVGAYETIEHAVSQGANVVVNVSSGNKADALRKAAQEYNNNKPLEQRVKVIHIIAGNKRMEDDLRCSAHSFEYSIPVVFPEITTRWLTPEDRIAIARGYFAKNPDPRFPVKGIVDVTHFIPKEYVRQAEEILRQKFDGRYMDVFAVQVGSAIAFAAFYEALKNLQATNPEIKTKLLGIAPEGENPIFHRFVFPKIRQDGTLEHVILDYKPASKADKLSCPYTDLLPVLDEARVNGHLFVEIGNKAIESANTFAFREGKKLGKSRNPLELEESGSIGFALADSTLAQKVGINPSDNVGIFVTGMGIYATPSWVLEQRKIERRAGFIREVRNNLVTAALVAGSMGGYIAIDYIAKQKSPAYAEFAQHRDVYNRKTSAIQEIARRGIFSGDYSMQQLIGKAEAEYGLQVDRNGIPSFPEPVLDEIILKYLELQKDKAESQRDMELENTLKSLLLQSQLKSNRHLNPN